MSELPIAALRPIVPHTPEEKRLRHASGQLEGVFVQQLFKVMRDTVPHDGLTDGGSGEEIFQGMMDEHLASLVPQGWEHGLGAAIYRQLHGALIGAKADAAPTNDAGDSH
ncbi:MAG TPA: rod-binding protein [Longimicrobiaceae bacterium]|jgi:flagellar protein FlgJ|nr:rod-binding protein [Longimicrobiaceae bacterium]